MLGAGASRYNAADDGFHRREQQGSLEAVCAVLDRLHDAVKRWFGAPWPLLVAAAAFALVVLGWQASTLTAPITGEHNWRQADTYSVAYNFVHEDGRFMYPRVDWSKGRSGIMGMETPVYTYTTAQLMRVFGDNPFSGRLVSWLSVVAALVASFVAFRPLPSDFRDDATGPGPNPLWLPLGIACFSVITPLFFFEGRQVQPDPMMGGLTMAAAACFHLYAKRERPALYALAMLVYLLAVGAKSPAIIAGPTLWLLSFSASPRLRWYTPIVRGIPFVLPLLLYWGWEKWADHLTQTFNGGEVYFATKIKWNEYWERFRDRDAMRRAFRFVFTSYMSNWVLLPALFTGIVLSFRRGLRAISLPMLLWLLIGLFFCAGSERLTWHWYYTFMLMLPAFYFGGVGLATLFEGVAAYERTSHLARWGLWSTCLALMLTRWVGGEPRLLQAAIGASFPPGGHTWTSQRPFFALLGIMVVSIPLAIFVRFRRAPWLGNALAGLLVSVAVALSFPRAVHDTHQTFLWRSRTEQWPDMQAHWIPMRRALDQVTTRKDVFVVDGGNPWYLYLAMRKGYVKGEDPPPEELRQYEERKVRFYLHFKDLYPPLRTLSQGRLLRQGPRWELYCYEAAGCPEVK